MTGESQGEEAVAQALVAHEARNRALLDRIRELGTPLDLPRPIDCFFWAPSQEAAGLLVKKLLARGFAELCTEPPDDADGAWSGQGQLHESPARVGAPVITEELIILAAELGAEYDGWGTSLAEAGDVS